MDEVEIDIGDPLEAWHLEEELKTALSALPRDRDKRGVLQAFEVAEIDVRKYVAKSNNNKVPPGEGLWLIYSYALGFTDPSTWKPGIFEALCPELIGRNIVKPSPDAPILYFRRHRGFDPGGTKYDMPRSMLQIMPLKHIESYSGLAAAVGARNRLTENQIRERYSDHI